MSKLNLLVDRRDICYLQWLIESYNGMASMSTINQANGQVEIAIAPGCKQEINELIHYLKQEGDIHVREEKSM